MKRFFVFCFLAFCASIIAQPTKTIDFQGISCFGNVTIEIQLTDGPSGFSYEMKEGREEALKIESNGKILKIGIPNNAKMGRSNASASVVLFCNKLSEITLKSGAKIYGSESFDVENLDISLSGGSSLSLVFNAKNISVEASSKSKVELFGKANKSIFSASSASRINASNLEVEVALVNTTSAAHVSVNANEELLANTSAGGTVKYIKLPKKLSKNNDLNTDAVGQL